MIALIVIGGIIGYFLIGTVVAGIATTTFDDVDETDALGIAIIWPLAIFAALMITLIAFVTVIIERRD